MVRRKVGGRVSQRARTSLHASLAFLQSTIDFPIHHICMRSKSQRNEKREKTDPTPRELETLIEPFMSEAILRAMERPSPDPAWCS